jgi:hypothetical protein
MSRYTTIEWVPVFRFCRLVLQQLAAGFSIGQGSNITLRQLHVDMARLPYTLATATKINATSVVFSFDPSVYPFPAGSPWLYKALAIMEYDAGCR